MENPRAPYWLRKKLREFDPRLAIVFNGRARAWELHEKVPYVRNFGVWNGIKILELKERNQRVTTLPGLGSRVIEIAKELRTSRFKSVDHMIKELKIR